VAQAGAIWSDEEVAVDDNIVSSAGNDGLPAFIEAFVNVINGGEAEAQSEAA
jgi:putative intracellular protease/amidase